MVERGRLKRSWYTRGRVLKEKDLKEGLVIWAHLQLYENAQPTINRPVDLRMHHNPSGHFWMLGDAEYDYEPIGDPEEDCCIEFPEGVLTLYEAVTKPKT